MATILNIHTALEVASISLSQDGGMLSLIENPDVRSHSSWLHPSIQQLIKTHNIAFHDLDAVAVTIGPGSYTGLRVGLSAAKGLCYALSKPLIAIGTLDVMAETLRRKHSGWICPMIDARRMEVFTALYDSELQYIEEPTAKLLDVTSFEYHLTSNQIVFGGNGALKFQELIQNKNASFDFTQVNAADMVSLSHDYYDRQKFGDLAYIEPLYLKEFYFATTHQ